MTTEKDCDMDILIRDYVSSKYKLNILSREYLLISSQATKQTNEFDLFVIAHIFPSYYLWLHFFTPSLTRLVEKPNEITLESTERVLSSHQIDIFSRVTKKIFKFLLRKKLLEKLSSVVNNIILFSKYPLPHFFLSEKY